MKSTSMGKEAGCAGFFFYFFCFFSVALFDDNWVKDILVARYSHFFCYSKLRIFMLLFDWQFRVQQMNTFIMCIEFMFVNLIWIYSNEDIFN